MWWLDIKAKLDVKILSTNTTYAAYFVYKLANIDDHGFLKRPVQLSVYFEGHTGETHGLFLTPVTNIPSHARGNEWKEIKMGEFFNEHGDDGTAVASLFDFEQSSVKRGLVVEGIEFRPKSEE